MVDEQDNLEPAGRLGDFPDWGYLLQEFYTLYRYSSAGGSSNIRSHQKDVRHLLSRLLNADPQVLPGPPMEKPVCAHLNRALDRGLSQATASLVRTIERVRDQLHWEYGYSRVPPGLRNKFAFAELLGPKGPVVADSLILGLVLFAPGTTYPTHSHQGITESYFCLSGAISENHVGVYAPGSLILNPPDHPHRITTSASEPSLLAYSWLGAPERLAHPRMVFSRQARGDNFP